MHTKTDHMELDGGGRGTLHHMRAYQIKNAHRAEKESIMQQQQQQQQQTKNSNTSILPNTPIHMSPKPRPLPAFFAESATFSTKKEKETPKLADIHPPPKPPIKSCPPISRLKPMRKPDHEGARVISFLNHGYSSLVAAAADETLNDPIPPSQLYDDRKHHLYFEQCFEIEGNLGFGSFGKVNLKARCILI